MYGSKVKVLLSTILIVICLYCLDVASGACCRKPMPHYCGDCTAPTPCCGYKRCNVFCCGCRCRKAPPRKVCGEKGERCYCRKIKRRRSLSTMTTELSTYEMFTGFDINKSGLMEQLEFTKALESLQITDNMTVFHHWSVMDENKNGIITIEEFDNEKV